MGRSWEPDAGEMGDEFDEIIKALADKRRRYILYDLSMSDPPVMLVDLAERLANWLGAGKPREVKLALIHSHLPVLEGPNLIEFDRDSHSVSITTRGNIANECREAYVDQFMAKCC